MMEDILANDPNYTDPRAVVSDMVDLFGELSDVLADNAAVGDFGRHNDWLLQAERLTRRLCKLVPVEVMNLYETDMRTALARLRAAFELRDVQSRA